MIKMWSVFLFTLFSPPPPVLLFLPLLLLLLLLLPPPLFFASFAFSFHQVVEAQPFQKVGASLGGVGAKLKAAPHGLSARHLCHRGAATLGRLGRGIPARQRCHRSPPVPPTDTSSGLDLTWRTERLTLRAASASARGGPWSI